MKYKKVFPRTSLKTVDVLTSDGAVGLGCYADNGKLVPAINNAVRLSYASQSPTFSWYAEGPEKYVIFTQNRIYYTSGGLNAATALNIYAKAPSMVETVINDVPTAYFIGDTSYIAFDSKYAFRSFKGAVNTCVLKNGRIFGVDNNNPYKIKWSGEGGIDDWNEGIAGAGWVELQYGYGEILNLIVYKDTIVAVREYGLTFFSAHGTPENYRLTYLECRLPKICKNTAAVVGGKLAFYTEDGLYFYDGNKVEKCSLSLAEEILSPKTATGANGKYFLCGTSKTLNKNVVLVYDAMRNLTYLIDVAANTVSVGESIHAYTDLYEFRLEEGGSYAFISGELDFSSSKEKVLKEVILRGASNARLEVIKGGEWNIFGGVRGKYRPNMRDKSFKIKVCGKEKLNGVAAVAEVVDGV